MTIKPVVSATAHSANAAHRAPFTPVGRAPVTPAASGFVPPLEALCALTPGARAALLVDDEGERVEHASARAGILDTTLAREALAACGAHWQIVARQARGNPSFASLRTMAIATAASGFVVHWQRAGYVILVTGAPSLITTYSARALRACELEVAEEAGWSPEPSQEPPWQRASVRTAPHGAPRAFSTRTTAATEIAAIELPRAVNRERRFAILAGNGAPAIELVREHSGAWFAAILPDANAPQAQQ